MKKLAYVGLLMLFTNGLALNNNAAKPAFGGTTWYSNAVAVKTQLISRGYTPISSIARPGARDFTFSGKVNGVSSLVQAWFNNKNQLVAVSVIFDTNQIDNRSFPIFRDFENQLKDKYGNPVQTNTLEKLSDGLDLLDIKDGKTEITDLWNFDQSGYAIALYIGKPFPNKPDVHPIIEYVSPADKAEMDRRQKDGDL